MCLQYDFNPFLPDDEQKAMQVQENLKMAVANVFPRPFDSRPTAGAFAVPGGSSRAGLACGPRVMLRVLCGVELGCSRCQMQHNRSCWCLLWCFPTSCLGYSALA